MVRSASHPIILLALVYRVSKRSFLRNYSRSCSCQIHFASCGSAEASKFGGMSRAKIRVFDVLRRVRGRKSVVVLRQYFGPLRWFSRFSKSIDGILFC